jgi:hypothetical protein
LRGKIFFQFLRLLNHQYQTEVELSRDMSLLADYTMYNYRSPIQNGNSLTWVCSCKNGRKESLRDLISEKYKENDLKNRFIAEEDENRRDLCKKRLKKEVPRKFYQRCPFQLKFFLQEGIYTISPSSTLVHNHPPNFYFSGSVNFNKLFIRLIFIGFNFKSHLVIFLINLELSHKSKKHKILITTDKSHSPRNFKTNFLI